MVENQESINSLYISLISLSLTILSKISDNSFITLILLNKKTPLIILYISSILSSLFLNFISIVIGYLFHLFLNIDIFINYFIIIIFALYGFISLFISCQILKNKDKDDSNKLIEEIINNSSDEDSERIKFNIKSEKNKNNEMEIELDNLNEDKSISNDDNKLDDKENNNENKFKIFWNILYSLILVEIGEKIQIVNISLASKYQKGVFLISGNFFGNIIINPILILYGVEIFKNKINNIVLALECIVYLGIAFYYIYLSFLVN